MIDYLNYNCRFFDRVSDLCLNNRNYVWTTGFAVDHVTGWTSSTTKSRRPWLEAAAIVVICGVGATLRIHLLQYRDFWTDEALSVLLASIPLRTFWHSLWDFQANMALYYLLLRGWLVLGDSEGVVRAMSVVFGVGAIPMTFLLGRRLFGSKAAFAAAALMAVNAFHVRYSQEARSYSLVMFLAAASSYFFVRLVRSPRNWGNWAAYVALCTAGVYAQFFFYLVIVAHLISLLPDFWKRLPLKRCFFLAAAFLVLTLPMTLFIVFRDQGQLSWVTPLTFGQLSHFVAFFTGNARWPLAVLYVAACALAIVPVLAPGDPMSIWGVRFVATWLVFPILATVAVSLFKPAFSDRFMSICAPALTLLAGVGLAKLDHIRLARMSWLSSTVLALMLGLSLWGLHCYNISFEARGDAWQAAVDFVQRQEEPSDAFIFYRASALWPFDYYHRRSADLGAAPLVLFPPQTTNAQQQPDIEALGVSIERRDRVWLVLDHADLTPERQDKRGEIVKLLTGKFHVASQQSFRGVTGRIEIYRYDRNRG